MAKKVNDIKLEQGQVLVTRTYLEQTVAKREKIKIRPFVTNPAHVSVKFGATIPVADFQFARVDVSVSVPCYVEEIREAFVQVRDLVDSLIEEETERLSAGLVPEEE